MFNNITETVSNETPKKNCSDYVYNIFYLLDNKTLNRSDSFMFRDEQFQCKY